ncbi:MAG: threonine aldolase [Bdellovibrionales bacterium RIFCSPHIGHO2_01_FULL_40_29]|nr:MAG: threonine aldolase [Bdellovibrionales bacterium RIFCSPHIGHO2_01_FULL_40_29]OFZ34193.1 MAG: threonine aldolase [Bdellovibrionales bacterium RIFCSPHIGHO2_02_FULL_40_15]
MKGFGSDNHSGVHPQLLQALIECNVEHAPSYGTDSFSEQAIVQFKKQFGEQAKVFFVFNGTASNVLSLRTMMKRHESVLCSDISHLNMDECGAPEFFAGKLIPLPHTDGKLALETLKHALIRRGDQHFSQPRAISLTQPTELGTCYSLTEIKAITEWAHQNNMLVHIDGARLSNAVYTLQTTFKKMTTDCGIDVVSFGGTKNGLMMGEAIIVLNPQLGEDLKYLRKQAAQLPSKTRFIAYQFSKYLSTQLYLEIATHACTMAEQLAHGLSSIPQIQITRPRQSNAVFARIPQPWIKILREQFFFYVWDEKTFECRLMTSWDTQDNEITAFIDLVKELSLAEV